MPSELAGIIFFTFLEMYLSLYFGVNLCWFRSYTGHDIRLFFLFGPG